MSPAILSAKSPEELQKSEKVSFERSGLLLVPRTSEGWRLDGAGVAMSSRAGRVGAQFPVRALTALVYDRADESSDAEASPERSEGLIQVVFIRMKRSGTRAGAFVFAKPSPPRAMLHSFTMNRMPVRM